MNRCSSRLPYAVITFLCSIFPWLATFADNAEALSPFDAGEYGARAINSTGEVLSSGASVTVGVDLDSHSVARWWNEFMTKAMTVEFSIDSDETVVLLASGFGSSIDGGAASAVLTVNEWVAGQWTLLF